MHLRLHRFDIGKRVSEADCASGNRGGNIEKRNAKSRAAALVRTGFAGESRDEFLAGCVILHVGGSCFGVGENFARGVDDSGTGAGGLTFLRGDFGKRVGAVDFDAVGKEKCFLRQVALDLGA